MALEFQFSVVPTSATLGLVRRSTAAAARAEKSMHSVPHALRSWLVGNGCCGLGGAPRLALAIALFVGDDDLLHERMAHDVFVGEAAKCDAFGAGQELARFAQSAARAVRQIGFG